MLSDVTMRLMAFLPEYMLICSIEVLIVTVTSYKYNINHHSYGQIESLFQFKSTKTGHFMLSNLFSSFQSTDQGFFVLSNPFLNFQSTDQGFFVLSTVPAKRIVPHYYFAFSEKSNTFAFPTRRSILHVPLSVLAQAPASCEARAHRQPESTPARMAESVDALVSNTSGAIRAGSIPAPGTSKRLSITLGLFACTPSQPQSAALTAPFRGIPTAPDGRVGRPRCCDFLRKSC